MVRSLTNGAVENVPIARNCPVPCKLPTVRVAGMMVSETSGSGAVVAETVRSAVADTTVPSGFFSSAVMVGLPAFAPVTAPVAVTVARPVAVSYTHLDVYKRQVLLCSEATPEHCHRRLVLEYLQKHWDGVTMRHL